MSYTIVGIVSIAKYISDFSIESEINPYWNAKFYSIPYNGRLIHRHLFYSTIVYIFENPYVLKDEVPDGEYNIIFTPTDNTPEEAKITLNDVIQIINTSNKEFINLYPCPFYIARFHYDNEIELIEKINWKELSIIKPRSFSVWRNY